MEIKVAFKTSKGIFLDADKAWKKKNRETYGSSWSDDWEEVKSIYVLTDGIKFFELKEIKLS